MGNICGTKPYKNWVLQNHLFNAPTERGNMSYKTDAESVGGFIKGFQDKEPHTALEDITGWEIPILCAIVKRKAWRDRMRGYAWQDVQVRDHYEVK